MSRFVHTFFALVLVFLFLHQTQGWEYVVRDNIKYVTMSEVRSEYAITSQKKEGSSWLYEAGGEMGTTSIYFKLRSGSQEMYANGLKFILSYPVIEDPVKGMLISAIDVTKIVRPILTPSLISGSKTVTTVILDPGHGGHDAGARNRADLEKNLNLSLAKKLRPKLQKLGFKVVLTRETDTFLSLQERVNIANKYNDAIFISIHFNSGRSSATGLETFTLAPTGTSSAMSRSVINTPLAGNANDGANIALAAAVQQKMLRLLSDNMKISMFDRGIKRARFSVLCTIKHPAILVEGGFMSNPQDAQLIRRNDYQNQIAFSISEGVRVYRKALNRSGNAASTVNYRPAKAQRTSRVGLSSPVVTTNVRRK